MSGLDTLEQVYIDHHVADGRSPKTITHSQNTFLLFRRFLAANGVDLHTVKRLAGHSSLSVTKGYLNLSGQEMKEKLQVASPYEDAIRRVEPERHSGRRRLESA